MQKYPIIDVRGRGLMLAAEFGGVDGGLTARPHTAADITHAAAKRGMLLMGAGGRLLAASAWRQVQRGAVLAKRGMLLMGAGARLAAFGDCLSLFLVRCIDVPRGVGGTLWQRQACCSWGQVGGCFCRLIKAAGLQRKKERGARLDRHDMAGSLAAGRSTNPANSPPNLAHYCLPRLTCRRARDHPFPAAPERLGG